ncbi:MAG: hypothetical protein CMO80_13250 [Verrucomicrobiales bacterium]|nr:hypothetical protein [Verrucomicrobiales bacterium]|tara:strand:+ start:331 stop:627 length:297 start_codon:yes stop_codon:yes gene_type:complete
MCCYANFADLTLFNRKKPIFAYADRELHDGFADRFAPVAYYGSNAWGLHDMLGNASEFVADLHPKHGASVTREGSWATPLEKSSTRLFATFRNWVRER